MRDKYSTIKQDFLIGKIKGCKNYFEENGNYLETAYCYLMLDNINKAKEFFNKAKSNDMRAVWGLFLLQMIEENIYSFPSYLQIRNFLEIDLSLLLIYCKGDYIKNIVKYADYMAFYNPESYKFLGRVFWAHNYLSASMYFLNKAKDTLYQDPELHYMLGYIYYYNEKDIKKSAKSISTCLEILPEYAPAKNFMKILN